MNKQDTPDYYLFQLRCLLDQGREHYDAMGASNNIEDAISEMAWQIGQMSPDNSEPRMDENLQGAYELGINLGVQS